MSKIAIQKQMTKTEWEDKWD